MAWQGDAPVAAPVKNKAYIRHLAGRAQKSGGMTASKQKGWGTARGRGARAPAADVRRTKRKKRWRIINCILIPAQGNPGAAVRAKVWCSNVWLLQTARRGLAALPGAGRMILPAPYHGAKALARKRRRGFLEKKDFFTAWRVKKRVFLFFHSIPHVALFSRARRRSTIWCVRPGGRKGRTAVHAWTGCGRRGTVLE